MRMGRALFAAAMIACGVLGFVSGDFAPIWQPVGKDVPAREALIYLCAIVSLVMGLGLLWPRTIVPSARVLSGYLILWMLVFNAAHVIRAPVTQDAWSGIGETAVYVAAALVLAGSAKAIRAGTIFYGLAMIPFGIAHFTYANETASLVPAWLPGHLGIAYLTGCAYLAAGVSILAGVVAKWAAALSTLQMGLFTLFVWVPIVTAGAPSAFVWSEFVVSCVLTASAWTVAESYTWHV